MKAARAAAADLAAAVPNQPRQLHALKIIYRATAK
jgi:hypothetical protein